MKSRFFFDETKQDMVLGGRRRGDQGKGLRALTHAAFTIGVQQAVKTLGRSPAGFVVLGSPLVNFCEADHEEELAQDDKIARWANHLRRFPTLSIPPPSDVSKYVP